VIGIDNLFSIVKVQESIWFVWYLPKENVYVVYTVYFSCFIISSLYAH